MNVKTRALLSLLTAAALKVFHCLCRFIKVLQLIELLLTLLCTAKECLFIKYLHAFIMHACYSLFL